MAWISASVSDVADVQGKTNTQSRYPASTHKANICIVNLPASDDTSSKLHLVYPDVCSEALVEPQLCNES